MKEVRSIKIGIRLTEEEKEKLDKIADYYKSTQSSIIRRFIEREYEVISKNDSTLRVL